MCFITAECMLKHVFSVVPSQRMHLLHSVGDGFCLET